MPSSSPSKHATVSSETSSPSPTPSTQANARRSSQATSFYSPRDNIYQPQPLKEAVSMAFDNSDVSQQISPELVKHITEQVISNLKSNGFGGASRHNLSHKQTPTSASSIGDSSNSLPPRDVYTPPSPNREDLANIGPMHADMQPIQTDGVTDQVAASQKPRERFSMRKEDASSSVSQSSPDDSNGQTTLEKIWGSLFDDDGKPTIRLGQFLRGLALHIIEDFEPKNSLVITPQKMFRFYEETKLAEETYPWADIFGGRMSTSSLSHLYRDLHCQHHFVQRQFHEKPTIPALTPVGFQCWMTLLIQAHPEAESMRLAKVSMDMPVSNADDRRDRFPKQLSRRLFPKQPNYKVRDLFQDAVLADRAIELPRHNNGPDQPPPPRSTGDRPTASAPPDPQIPHSQYPQHLQHPQLSPKQSQSDRDRKPYSGISSETATEERNQSRPIERERKPYSAAPGGGKMYDNDDASRFNSKPQRANSMKTTSRPAPPSDEELRSRPGRARTGSQSSVRPNFAKPNRIRSPSTTSQPNPQTRSECGLPPSTYDSMNSRASHIYDDSDNELERAYSRELRDERNRRRVPEDMPRPYVTQSYPIQPKPIFDPVQYQRSQQQQQDAANGYGSGYNGNPYPPPRYG